MRSFNVVVCRVDGTGSIRVVAGKAVEASTADVAMLVAIRLVRLAKGLDQSIRLIAKLVS